MAKSANPVPGKPEAEFIRVMCPCCDAELTIDPSMGAVIRHKEADGPKTFSDLDEAAKRQRAEAEKRDELYRRSMEETRNRESLLSRKFDSLLKHAQTEPDDAAPPKRPFDFD
jgi:hypothetical protein